MGGLSFGADGYNPRLDRGSSPAYVGTVCGNFGIDAGTEWGSYLSAFDERLAQQGYHTLKAPLNTPTVGSSMGTSRVRMARPFHWCASLEDFKKSCTRLCVRQAASQQCSRTPTLMPRVR